MLSEDGRRVFFDSRDDLVIQDTNAAADVYEWEAPGTGSCTGPKGCLQLISSGRAAGGARFADASADGADAFFLTGASLVGPDLGAVDLYDARVGGGFPDPTAGTICEGDLCQPLPSEPDDPIPGSLVSTAPNPSVHFAKDNAGRKGKRHRVRKRGRHVRGKRGGKGRRGKGRGHRVGKGWR